jgi:hypothetical protein
MVRDLRLILPCLPELELIMSSTVLPGLCIPKLLALSLLICLNARSLLADMLDIDKDYFRTFLPPSLREKEKPTDLLPVSADSHKLRKPNFPPLTHQVKRSRGNELDFMTPSMNGLNRAPSRSTIGGGQISPVYPIGISRSVDSRLEVTSSFGELGKEEEVIVESLKYVDFTVSISSSSSSRPTTDLTRR